MREGQRKLDLVVDGLSVTSALERNAKGGGASPESSASEAKRAHLCSEEWWKGDGDEGQVYPAGSEVQRSTFGCRLFPSVHVICEVNSPPTMYSLHQLCTQWNCVD